MELRQAALAYLERNRLACIDLLEALRRGSAELLYAAPDGVLLYERESGAHMMSAADRAGAGRCFARLPRCGLLVGHEMWYREEAARRYGLSEEQICYQAAWLAPEPPSEPEFSGELRLLDAGWAGWLYEHYSHAFGGVEYMEGAVRRGMLAAFVDGAPAGFIGVHDEGSIGMLEVLPPYRRRGLGEVLLRAAVRRALAQGRYAYGQVFDNNAASLALQKKVGMTLTEEPMFWLF